MCEAYRCARLRGRLLRADKAGVTAGQAERRGGTAFRQEAATVQMKFVCGQRDAPIGMA